MCPAWPGGSSAVDTADRGGGLEVQILWSNSRLVKEKYSVKYIPVLLKYTFVQGMSWPKRRFYHCWALKALNFRVIKSLTNFNFNF